MSVRDEPDDEFDLWAKGLDSNSLALWREHLDLLKEKKGVCEGLLTPRF